MNVGSISIEHLSEGQFNLYPDGSLEKNLEASIGKKPLPEDDLYFGLSTEVGIDPILVQTGEYNVLLDAGLGLGLDEKRANPNISNIRTNLEIFGLGPENIDHVILTHLHHDHIAGLTYSDGGSSVQTTMPNATIWVQRSEWKYALELTGKPNETGDVPYKLDDFYRLVADGRVQFIEENATVIVPGVEAIKTGGHTPGHQIVRIRNGKDVAYYFGDLVPNEHFLNFRMMPDADIDITASRQIKMLLLKQAYMDEAEILFYHSVHLKHGRLEKDTDRHFVLKNS